MAKRKVSKGKRVPQECVDEAAAKLNLFDVKDIQKNLSDIFIKAKEYKDVTGQAALRRAAQEIGKEQLAILQGRCGIKARNVTKYEALVNKIKKSVNLRSLLIPTTKNKDFNVETSQKDAINELQREFFRELNGDEIKELGSGKIDQEILAAADGRRVSNPTAQKIGDILKKYPEEIRNPKMVESDALPFDMVNKDRMLRHVHNQSRIASAGQSLGKRLLSRNKVDANASLPVWRTRIKELIDERATAYNIGAIDLEGNIIPGRIDKFLDNMFDNIVNDKNAEFTRSIAGNDKEALARKQQMYVVFKDWQSFGAYNKEYGQGGLFRAIMSDIHGSGNQIGMSRIFGDSPLSMFNDLRDAQKKIRPQGLMTRREADSLFNQVAGVNKVSWSPTFASVGANLRAWSSMSRLGKLVIQSLSDISQVAGIAQRSGYGYWKHYVNGILGQLNLLPNEERMLLAKSMQLNLKNHMGYMGRFGDAANMGEVTSKVSNWYYWLNLTEGWTKGLKTSAITDLAKNLGKDSVKGFNEINSQTRSFLEKHNITEHEWDALRSMTGKTKASTKNLFLMDNAHDLNDAQIKSLWEKSNKEIPLSQYRNTLNRKVFALFDTVSEAAALDPGAYERMVTTAGTTPGTITGEATRIFMQFKSYPIAAWRRTMYGGWKDMDSTQAKLAYALNMAAGNFMLGYLSVVLGNYLVGKTTPELTDMSGRDLISMMTPGLGTFARILDPKNQNPDLIGNLITTPSLRLIEDPLVSAVALSTGNPDKAKKVMKDFVKYANPIGTFPIAEPYLNKLMGKEPYLEAGQQQLFGA